jgi:hypothetical protein
MVTDNDSKDGILKSFGIKERDFKPEYQESRGEILIQVFKPQAETTNGTMELCGYIRFKWGSDGCGTLEMANFRANLQRHYLGFGGTTKAKDPNQAGQHGEGLKLAALVFRRHPNNYGVRFHSSKFNWNIGFDTRNSFSVG